MTRYRKQPEWIRPTAAGKLIGVSRQTIIYRAGHGRYRTKQEPETGVMLVNRRDVMRDAKPSAPADDVAGVEADAA
jgi:hypothetical protein